MAQESHVGQVSVLNRRDCCSKRIDGHEVWVGEHKCGTLFSSKANKSGWITLKCPWTALGSEITIKKPKSLSPKVRGKADYLTICGYQIKGQF